MAGRPKPYQRADAGPPSGAQQQRAATTLFGKFLFSFQKSRRNKSTFERAAGISPTEVGTDAARSAKFLSIVATESRTPTFIDDAFAALPSFHFSRQDARTHPGLRSERTRSVRLARTLRNTLSHSFSFIQTQVHPRTDPNGRRQRSQVPCCNEHAAEAAVPTATKGVGDVVKRRSHHSTARRTPPPHNSTDKYGEEPSPSISFHSFVACGCPLGRLSSMWLLMNRLLLFVSSCECVSLIHSFDSFIH